MKIVRKSVFETNSSSCHSISIESGDVYTSITPNSDNKIVLDPMEFGWETENYNDPISKLTYSWIYVEDWSGENKEKFHKILSDVVCEHTGADEIIMKSSGKSWCEYGYIDHQSVECGALNYLFDDPQQLKEFIFSSKSVLRTDNDNY